MDSIVFTASTSTAFGIVRYGSVTKLRNIVRGSHTSKRLIVVGIMLVVQTILDIGYSLHQQCIGVKVY